MKLHEILQFSAAAIPIIAFIWQFAEMKNQLYKYIDSTVNSRDYRINELEKNLAVHKEIYEERKDFVDYQLNGLGEAINHKFNRCMDEIKALKVDLNQSQQEIKNLKK